VNDQELLQCAARGDESAFLMLYRDYRTSVFRFAYRMTGAVDAADEISQDAFLAVLKGAGKFNGSHGTLRAYLLGVTRNLVRRRLIREGRYTDLNEATTVEAGDSWLERGEVSSAVRDAVQALPDGQREVVVLFEYEGLTLDEISKALEIEVGAVKARLHRARESLRKRLAVFHENNHDRR
jgi:RNA polymerase sigma-70 factor, ECF subfamily